MDKRYERVTALQMKTMIDYLEKNPNLISGKLWAKDDKQRMWEQLASSLNSLGFGAKRDALRWKKCWADMKCNVKAKAARINKHRSATGGPSSLEKLTRIEERMINLIRNASSVGVLNASSVGVFDVGKVGLDSMENIQPTDVLELELCKRPDDASIHSTRISTKRKRECKNDDSAVKSKFLHQSVVMENHTLGLEKHTAALESHTVALQQLTAAIHQFTKVFMKKSAENQNEQEMPQKVQNS